MNELAPCPHCKRHLRVHETTCPFCGSRVAGALSARPAASTGGLSRAAILALGASLAAATGALLPACGDSDDDDSDAGQNSRDGGSDASTGDAATTPADAGQVVAVYGAPVFPDAGSADASVAPDAGKVVPVYGAPTTPPDAGGGIQPVYGAAVQPPQMR